MSDPLFIVAIIVIIICLIGYLIDNRDNQENVESDEDEIVFKSAITRGGDIIIPQKLIFTPTRVRLETNHGIKELYTSSTRQIIPYSKLTGVSITRNLIGCNIEIIGDGVQSIKATNFTDEDSTKIEQIVNEILNY